LREGDIILALANTDVASVKEFEAALAKHDKTKPLPVLIRRGELAQFVIIKPAR
jgi:serine protease Do